jgi:MFS family permease
MLLTGGVFSAMFGMAAVWGSMTGLSVREITLFVAAIYLGGLRFQYPIGWASDLMDRRHLILGLCLAGAAGMLAAFALPLPFWAQVGAAMVLGGVINPLYSLLIAYTNDYLGAEDMAAASAGLIFLNGLGAIGGPLASGWLMARVGPEGFFLFLGLLFAALAVYTVWRMTRRAAPAAGAGYRNVVPTASAMAVEVVRERGTAEARG